MTLNAAAWALQSDPPAQPDVQSSVTATPQRDPQFAKLLVQLGDERYALRERAERELEALGPRVYDDLLTVLRDRDPEISQRANRIAARLRQTICRSVENEQMREALNDYFGSTADTRRELIPYIRSRATDYAANVLVWIVKFEPEPILAKYAALELLNLKPTAAFGARQRNELIQAALTESRRVPAQWLLAIAAAANAPEKLLPKWDEFLRDERAEYERQGQEVQRENLALMYRYAIRLALQNKNQELAGARLRSLLEIEAQDAQLIPQLLEWIVDEQAWPLIVELERHLPALLESPDNRVVYLLAEAADLQMQPDKVKQLLERAAKIQPDNGSLHFETARRLQLRGRWDWAEAEFTRVIQSSKSGNQTLGFMARAVLGQSLQDRERYGDAAEHFAQARKILRNNENIADRYDGDDRLGSNALSAQEHFNRALEAKKNNDLAKHFSELQLANQASEEDVDVLIALFQYNHIEQTQRQKIAQKVAVQRERYETLLEIEPNDAQNLNQYAWLVANTEGDFDRAVAASLKSLEKRPEAGGYYDTLAHCYFAKKDYDNAVKAQRRALELDPHTQTIRRALAKFEKAQAEAKGTP